MSGEHHPISAKVIFASFLSAARAAAAVGSARLGCACSCTQKESGLVLLEVVLLLFTFKVLFPNHVHLTRGNHESLNMNRIYGFEGEVKAKYDARMFQLFSEVFNCLPICYCLGGHTIVLHGGLFSRDDVTLDDLRKVDRFREPPEEGLEVAAA